MSSSSFVCNSFSTKFIHQVTKLHHVTHHYALLTAADQNMSCTTNNWHLSAPHFSNKWRPSTCRIDYFVSAYIPLPRFTRTILFIACHSRGFRLCCHV